MDANFINYGSFIGAWRFIHEISRKKEKKFKIYRKMDFDRKKMAILKA